MRFKIRHIPYLFLDLILVSLAFYFAYQFRFDFKIPQEDYLFFRNVFLFVIFTKVIIFYLNGLYAKMWRYVSMQELYTILRAVTMASAGILVLLFIFHRYWMPQLSFALSTIAIDWLLTIIFIGGIRIATRAVIELKTRRSIFSQAKPVLLVGAGDAGEAVVREMLKKQNINYEPVGFIDDDPKKQGMQIHGVRVLGTRKELSEIIRKYEIEEVIISLPSAPREVISDVLSRCEAEHVDCKTLPGIYELINGQVTLSQIRQVGVEDILGREPIKKNLQQISGYVKDKNILVTGAGGSIGAELCRQLIRFGPKLLIMIEIAENSLFQIEQEMLNKYNFRDFITIVGDIRDTEKVKAVFARYRPQVVFHAAAYKHVPLMEANCIEAIDNNVFGTRVLIEQSSHFGVEKFVFISTDKAVNSINIMGASKALAEQVVQVYGDGSETRFMIVRFGNVLGSSGSVIPIFREQIARGGPVTVTDPEMTRFFMTIPEAIQLIIQAGALGQGGEIFVLDMGEPVKIIDLARNMIKLSGFEPEKDIGVKIIGIRPGEKLHEELFNKDEEKIPTTHEKIFMAKKGSVDRDKFKKDLAELEEIAGKEDEERLLRKLSEILPTFKRKK